MQSISANRRLGYACNPGTAGQYLPLLVSKSRFAGIRFTSESTLLSIGSSSAKSRESGWIHMWIPFNRRPLRHLRQLGLENYPSLGRPK